MVKYPLGLPSLVGYRRGEFWVLCCFASLSLPIFLNSSILKYADDIMILHFMRDCEEDKLQVEWNGLR